MLFYTWIVWILIFHLSISRRFNTCVEFYEMKWKNQQSGIWSVVNFPLKSECSLLYTEWTRLRVPAYHENQFIARNPIQSCDTSYTSHQGGTKYLNFILLVLGVKMPSHSSGFGIQTIDFYDISLSKSNIYLSGQVCNVCYVQIYRSCNLWTETIFITTIR